MTTDLEPPDKNGRGLPPGTNWGKLGLPTNWPVASPLVEKPVDATGAPYVSVRRGGRINLRRMPGAANPGCPQLHFPLIEGGIRQCAALWLEVSNRDDARGIHALAHQARYRVLMEEDQISHNQ